MAHGELLIPGVPLAAYEAPDRSIRRGGLGRKVCCRTARRIAALYAIEAEVRGKPPDVRCAVRQVKSRALVEDLFAWFEAQLARLPGGSPTAKAIRYALNHRDGLVRFLDDGRIEPDTNTVERAIRPLCLCRKNALFASGDDGGALGHRRFARGNLQAERRRSAALLHRPADPPRRWLAQQPHR
jgi:hypothetical protein